MKTVAPARYADFECIAGQCRHSCCIGWEIDIDPDSLRRFQSMEGELGKRLRDNIDITEDGANFRLQGSEERCPFLNRQGLCDLILACGEDVLCQICTDHPRFRHFYTDRTEEGLGLCCEAAGKLLLGDENPMQLTVLEDDGIQEETDPFEQQLLKLRADLFALAQDRTRPVTGRVNALLPEDAIDWSAWADFLLSLERLDERWTQLLEMLPAAPSHPLSPALENPLEQLMCCLLYRHLPGALEDDDVSGRIAFAALMWHMAARLCRHLDIRTLDDFVELARLYSSEIEYSDENTCAILDRIAQDETMQRMMNF